MKNSLKKFLFFISPIPLFFACANESPLSDVENLDPSLIRVEINMDKSTSSTGSVTTGIIVNIRDKNSDLVELKTGDISVNGVNMALGQNSITNTPYYYINAGRLDVLSDSTYTFTIKVADSSEHTATITTQKNDLKTLNLPESLNVAETLIVAWTDTGFYSELNLRITKTIKTKNGLTKSESADITATEATSGEIKLPPSRFSVNSEDTLQTVSFYLQSTEFGEVSNDFKPGSYVRSDFSISGLAPVKQ